ncbi:MAG: OsmC family protein [Acidiferrobacterales bacterium]
MKTIIRWAGEASFEAETASGHKIIMDGAQEYGGQNKGPRPMEMLLVGLGGCASFDVVLILKRSRQDVRDCVAEISAERAETDPKVFTQIHIKFIVTGMNLDPARVERAVKLSEEKYCSASIMLGKTAEITHEIEIVEVE